MPPGAVAGIGVDVKGAAIVTADEKAAKHHGILYLCGFEIKTRCDGRVFTYWALFKMIGMFGRGDYIQEKLNTDTANEGPTYMYAQNPSSK